MHSEKYVSWRQTRSDVLFIGCKECDWFFASLDELESHLRSIHPFKGLQAVQKRASFEQPPCSSVTSPFANSPRDLLSPGNPGGVHDGAKSTKCKTRESLLRLCKEIKKSSPTEPGNKSSSPTPPSPSPKPAGPTTPKSGRPQTGRRTPSNVVTTPKQHYDEQKQPIRSGDGPGSDKIFAAPPLNKMEAFFAGNITICPYPTGSRLLITNRSRQGNPGTLFGLITKCVLN